MQETLLPPVAPSNREELPIFVEADRIQGVQGKELEAAGNVVVRRRGQVLTADKLYYSIPENAVTATGHVRVDRLGDVVTGDLAHYDLDTSAGYIDRPTYSFRQFGARGKAERLVIEDRDIYHAQRATYTNCAVGDDDWYLRVGKMDLDRLTDVGVAHDASVVFKDVPIFYTPWMDFPLTSRRKTGFLPPLIGTSNNSGFEIEAPFYWNIAPNLDYTIAPRLMARRGLQLNNEFRYLEPKFSGQAHFDYLPDDRVLNESRWFGSLQHSQSFSSRLSGYLNLQGVSDDTYFTDLSNNIAATSQTNLPREAGLTYNGDWWSFFGRVQEFQTLQNPDSPPVTPPYARVPQLALRAAKQNVGGFDLDFFGEVVNFQQTGQVSGWRQIYYPSVSYPYRNRLFWVTPKLGYNYANYSFNDGSQPSETRSLPIFSVDSGMTFERNTAVGSRNFRQTLEPRLYYVYIPFAEQNQLPVYDTAESDFNLAELFTENQFSGWDRINNANQISAALTSRLLDPRTGAEWIRGTLAQRYYFEPQEVTLSGPARTASRSDVLALLSGSITRAWSANFGVTYSLDQRQAQKLDVAVRYQPQLGRVLNLGYRFTQDFLEQLDVSGQWPLTRHWSGVLRWNYSLQDQSLLEALVGLEYTAGCWALRLVGHKFVTSSGTDTTSLLFQLELTGLSRIGNNPLELLRQNIGGYSRLGGRAVPAGPSYPGMETE